MHMQAVVAKLATNVWYSLDYISGVLAPHTSTQAGIPMAGVAAGGDEWQQAGPAERLSAAGPASAAADVVRGAGGPEPGGQSAEAELVNPKGHVWVSAVSAREHDQRLRSLWAEWAGQSLHEDQDGLAFGEQEAARPGRQQSPLPDREAGPRPPDQIPQHHTGPH